MNIPVLETARLKLRGHLKSDFELFAALWADPVTVRYTIGKPSTRQQSWSRMMTYLGHWELMGFGYWAVEEKSSGNYIGELGFADFKRDVTPSIEGLPELGWVISSHCHGRGYATEGLLAAISWGDSQFAKIAKDGPQLDRTVSMIDPANVTSLRVAEKLGFKEYARTTYLETLSIHFERKVPKITSSPEIETGTRY